MYQLRSAETIAKGRWEERTKNRGKVLPLPAHRRACATHTYEYRTNTLASSALFRPLNGKLHTAWRRKEARAWSIFGRTYIFLRRRREWKSEVVAGTAPRLRGKERKSGMGRVRRAVENKGRLRIVGNK